jgi:hypothetical protein
MGVTLFGIVELHYVAVAGATLHFFTDLPGNAMAEHETLPMPASAGHRTVKFRLQGTTKGKLYKAKVTSPGLVLLFGGRVFARSLGTSAPWAWFPLPITVTPDEWSKIPLPITKTADEWSKIPLPIAKTPDDWTALRIPMTETPDLQEWIDIPVAP